MGQGTEKEPRRAAALRYDPAREQAPRLIAAGEHRIAEAIIARARERNIPIYEDPLLVAGLLKLRLGSEIPPSLYAAVAQVLAFVYGLDRREGARS